MASAIFILDDNCDVIISRLYKQDLDTYHILENFKEVVGPSVTSSVPIIQFDGINYVYALHHDLIFLSVCLGNVDALLILQFLFKFVQLIQNYVATDKLDKELVQSNYTLIYELFDEVLDFGVPQSTDFSILREYIKVHQQDKEEDNDLNYALPRTSTTKISWRPKGIFYKKNEIFIDLIETISFQYNLQTGEIKKNLINGEMDLKCYLSGMPVCRLGMNEQLSTSSFQVANSEKEQVIFDNINFHQCVELSNLDKNQMQFIPPDGPTKLLSYSIMNVSTTNLKPIIVVDPLYKIFDKKDRLRLRISLDMRTFFKRKYLIKNLEIEIPIVLKQSKAATKKLFINFNKPPKFKTQIGNVILSLDKNLIIWKIPSVNSNSSSSIFTNISRNVIDEAYQMVSEFELLEEGDLFDILEKNEHYGKVDNNSLYYSKLVEEQEILVKNKAVERNNTMINLKFEIPYLSYSGLKIDFLKIVEEQYHFQNFPWVRYLIKNDDYRFKLGDKNFTDAVRYELLDRVQEPVKLESVVSGQEPEE